MSETEIATAEFTITHGTVHFPDGREESIEYADKWYRGGAIEFYCNSDELWEVYVEKKPGNENDEVRLRARREDSRCVTYSTSNFEKITSNREEELVAVAEVEVDIETIRVLWISNKTRKTLLDGEENPEVHLFERSEWNEYGKELLDQ